MRLPFDIVKLLEGFLLHKNLRAICPEYLERIVHFQPFIQNWVYQIASTGWPLNLNWARELCFSNFLLGLEVPKVHFSFSNITKSTNHENLAKWTNFDRVLKLLSEFKCWFTIEIVHGSHCRLLTCNYNKLLSIMSPLNILNLVVKNGNKFTIFAFMDSYVLERVLSIVAFSRRVILILRPDKYGMSRRSRNYLDVVSSRTCNVELGSLKITVEIVHIN